MKDICSGWFGLSKETCNYIILLYVLGILRVSIAKAFNGLQA